MNIIKTLDFSRVDIASLQSTSFEISGTIIDANGNIYSRIDVQLDPDIVSWSIVLKNGDEEKQGVREYSEEDYETGTEKLAIITLMYGAIQGGDSSWSDMEQLLNTWIPEVLNAQSIFTIDTSVISSLYNYNWNVTDLLSNNFKYNYDFIISGKINIGSAENKEECVSFSVSWYSNNVLVYIGSHSFSQNNGENIVMSETILPIIIKKIDTIDIHLDYDDAYYELEEQPFTDNEKLALFYNFLETTGGRIPETQYLVNESDLIAIADAIRERKYWDQNQLLEFPDDFIEAITSI